jgi:hypothetical protein
MEMVAAEAETDTAVQVFRYSSADKFSDMMRVKGGHSMDCANPFMHQITVMTYTLLKVDMTALQRDVTNKPKKIMVFGLIWSPTTPLKIWPAP